VLEKHQKPQDN